MASSLSTPPPGSGKKLADEHECPIDLAFTNLCERLNPTFRAWGMTPNHLTTVSLALTLVGLFLYTRGYILLGVALNALGYFFDCADGNYARRYEMTTKFGDYYDHFSDMLKLVLTTVLICSIPIAARHRPTANLIKGALLLLLVLATVHMGCQESASARQSGGPRRDDSELIGKLSAVCPWNSWIRVPRLFRTGTLQLGVALALLALPTLGESRS